MIIKKLRSDERFSCTFEEYDKSKSKMVFCSKIAVCKTGKDFLCSEHLKFVASNQKAEFELESGQRVLRDAFIDHIG